MKKKLSGIYYITDEKLSFDCTLNIVNEALQHGVKLIQYRTKKKTNKERLYEGTKLLDVCKGFNVPLIINDDYRLALDIGASGVHLGQSDDAVEKVRKLVGEDYIIGATAKTVEQGMEAEAQGADYLGVGALFPSQSKGDAIKIEMNKLREIKEAVTIPIFGIGGINENNITREIGKIVDGVAVIEVITNSNNIKKTIDNMSLALKVKE